MLVEFRHRSTKPTDPIAGSFYWVTLNDKVQLWFSPDGIADNLILLSNEVDESIISRIEAAEGNIGEIYEILNGINLNEYVKIDEISNYLNLSDSDLDIIAEKVNEKLSPPLMWEIKG